jgi:phospholipid N-methyltransferase
MRYWSECGSFLREYRRHGRDTGALLPSSRFLARALVAELRKPRPPARILEVGPGTGSVTRQIVRHLVRGDHFDIVEINAEFVALLKQRFEQERAFRSCREQLHVIHRAIEEIPGQAVYDNIISCLPLNSFPTEQVRRVFKAYTRLLKPGGTLTYFEYVLIRQLSSAFVNRQERRRLYRVGRVVGRYIRACQIHRQQVYMNVPPAIVRHLRLTPAPACNGLRPRVAALLASDRG